MAWKAIDGNSDYDIYRGDGEQYAYKIKFVRSEEKYYFFDDEELFNFLDDLNDQEEN